MERRKEDNKTSVMVTIIKGLFTLATTILTVFFGSQLYLLQNQTQQVNVNVINALGERATSDMNISESSEIAYVTNDLTQAYLILEQDNEALRQQVDNLKGFILEQYPSNEVDKLVTNGYVKESLPVRLDSLEDLDGEYYEEVASVKDLYGTTHSASYKMHARGEGRVAWVKFKLDGQYDRFSANVVTSEDTARNACMSVEIYVDKNLVSRIDDILRDEQVRPISANVYGGKVLEIKVIGTADEYYNICYITDTELTMLE